MMSSIRTLAGLLLPKQTTSRDELRCTILFYWADRTASTSSLWRICRVLVLLDVRAVLGVSKYMT
jgi:hypothetical protein